MQVDGPKQSYSNNKNSSVKVRDLIRYNKDYKVYNNNIHFYNFLYVIEIKVSGLFENGMNTVKVRLSSKSNKGYIKVRTYLLQLN